MLTLGTVNEFVNLSILKNFIKHLLQNDYDLSKYYLVIDNSKTLVNKTALKYYYELNQKYGIEVVSTVPYSYNSLADLVFG